MYMDLKSKHFTKSGSGRRHFYQHLAGYFQRRDKVGTTKLSRSLRRQSIFPPQKEHPFSSKK